MRAANVRKVGTHPVLLLALLALGLFASSCRNNEVEVPPLTGPSGHRLFITMEARPDHLVIHAPGRPRETSQITVQLKNQQGIGVPGENIKLRIANSGGGEINIGRLSDYNVTTDSAGFARVIYTAPDSAEQSRAILVYVLAILTNPAYPYEVTDRHGLDLELSAVQPGDCIFGFPGAPVPEFDADPNPGTINNPVCFDAQASTDNGFIVGYNWNFGDGTTGTGEVICHEYDDDDTYTVTLLVQDDEHNCEETSQSVVIERGEPATCSIIASPTTADINEEVNFTAITDDPDGVIVRYNWSFGDGTKKSSNKNTISHTYKAAGSFNVILQLVDDQGNISFCQTSVTVTSDPPDCQFTMTPTSGASPLFVSLDSSGSSDDTGIVQRNWDFGDGTTGSGTAITHTFIGACDNTGGPCQDQFNITLTLVDEDGNQSSCSQTLITTKP